jgi:hypothetical protein
MQTTMTTIAITDNGNITGQVWYNDDMKQTSELVHAGHIDTICGDMDLPEGVDFDEHYPGLESLNADICGFSFTEEAEYPEA